MFSLICCSYKHASDFTIGELAYNVDNDRIYICVNPGKPVIFRTIFKKTKNKWYTADCSLRTFKCSEELAKVMIDEAFM